METDRIKSRKAPYHPSHAVIYSQAHRSYSSVIRLSLYCCIFLSSFDLLRLLAAFSVLERVELSLVSVRQISGSIVRRRPSVNVVREIFVDGVMFCAPSQLAFLTHCWTWPRESSHQQATFHGLLPAEQKHVAYLCWSFMPNNTSIWYYLDAMRDSCDGGTTCKHQCSSIKSCLH